LLDRGATLGDSGGSGGCRCSCACSRWDGSHWKWDRLESVREMTETSGRGGRLQWGAVKKKISGPCSERRTRGVRREVRRSCVFGVLGRKDCATKCLKKRQDLTPSWLRVVSFRSHKLERLGRSHLAEDGSYLPLLSPLSCLPAFLPGRALRLLCSHDHAHSFKNHLNSM
jgi:hypothetical protein